MDVVRPISALLIVPIAWIAIAFGRQVNRRICPAIESDSISAGERCAFGLATGLIAVALGVLALGLSGLLTPTPVAALIVCLALLGWREHTAIVADIRSGVALGGLPIYALVGLALVGAAALGACFTPPTSLEWDSLSYHLADPKLYVAAHRISYIPWESHSNFAFDMEMLYCIGMLAHSTALAKLFNFTLGVAGTVGLYGCARRLTSPKVGLLTAAIFMTLPLVFWEAGTAYVDLAATSYAALALLALTVFARRGDARFAVLAGVMLGGMLGIKATALITIGFYAIGIVVHARMADRPPAQAFKSAIVMGLIAAAIGCPWYIKSTVYTGNPFYPFAFSLFGGKYWSEANAIPYAAAQASFGDGHAPVDLLMVPWDVTMYLLPDHRFPPANIHPFNDTPSALVSLSPLFLICALAALCAPLQPTRGMRLLAAYTAVAVVAWFALTQQVRYLLPVVPVMCILTAWSLSRIASLSAIGRSAAWVAGVVAIGFNAVILAQYSASMWQVTASPSQQQSFVAVGLDCYPAMQFLNTETPDDAKVICYGEPRTFYLDRDHMWGDLGSQPLYPPYDNLGTPQALRDWLTSRGYRYVLINTNGAHLTATTGWAGMVYALTLGSGQAPLFQDRGTVVYGL